MIARCWRGRTSADDAPRYYELFTSTVLPALQAIPGFVSARVMRRPHTLGVEFLVITEWASWEAIRTFAGASPDRAVIEPAARALLAEYDAQVEHFEVVS
jgi:heme-degrading monooxygenase HmoA